MVRRPKKNKREKEVVMRPPLSREEIEEKERQKENRELRKKELLESQKQNENYIKSCFSIVPSHWGIDGLGTRISPSTTSYKTFPLKTYSLKERNEIFNETITENTKEKLEDKMSKRILKRFRDGI
ncbi:hypothetical protein AALA56_07540 [Streptococcus hyointestinalis]|uniref:hypothetical protein n=1 Tax=Streptococcus hyointestinalis TaxID=1337 RepID=UPI0035189F00